ncbi:putative dolichyl-di-phosphooligosaccharide-protein glycotransferase [Cyclospora cayetanensis]|nr:putative dolichyl-di-phosphooligosaccharide-protein glycotransferase [Cyclospora cayetanensis]
MEPLPFSPRTNEGLDNTSGEEDAAEEALRFRVVTRKDKTPREPPRLQHVVDKAVAWGPTIMPLSKVLDDREREILDMERQQRKDIEGVRDCFTIQGVLSTGECERLVQAAECQGFEYWAEEAHAASSTGSISRSHVAARANHSYRSAYTLEVEHPDLADLLWQRVRGCVVQEVCFSDDDPERFERDLDGTWEACGVNSTFLFARYTSGENFGPHTDGCTIRDFNSRSLWPMVIYLNTPEKGGETVILSEEQKGLPLKTDEAGRFTADAECVVYECKPKIGNALLFYHTQMHEGRPVGSASVKYIIRTDVMYRRKEPLFTHPTDREAFALWMKAQLLAEKGETDAAAVLFRRMTKASPKLAHFYGL